MSGFVAPYAFVSYASVERERALAVADALGRAGVAVWLDRRSIAGGTSWSAEIVQGIEGCAALVLLVSPAAMASPNVGQEVQLAWEARRPILPLLLTPAEPSPTLRYALAGRQWIELLDRPVAAWQSELLRALSGLGVLPQAPPTDTPTPAPSAPAVAPRHNLPRQLTSFVGREAAIADVAGLLDTSALVTLSGVGGTGKTRLALAVAERVLATYPDGVWLVELAPLADPALLPQAVATALGVREQPGEPLVATLTAYLAPRRSLLVLDNCEHLIDACAHLAEQLLTHCPELRILATSREALGVPGEVPYRVPSLTVADQTGDAASVAASEAAQLFAARAQSVRPGFALTDVNAATVAQVCARLDGIPLALELAAARLRALPLEQLAARLDDRFRLLTGGSRTALPRQQTLQATIDWSYRLLEEDERTLLRRLSVFAGGWTLEAAEAICADASLEAWQVLDLLTRLVDKSLVLLDDGGEAARYRLLETVRQYARERLAETDEGTAVRDRHRDWCLALAERVAPGLMGSEQAALLGQLDAEGDNLRAALTWCQAGDVELGLSLATALYRYWFYRGRAVEGVQWLEAFLAAAPDPTVARAHALGRLGHLLGAASDDLARAQAVLEEAVAIGRALDAFEPRFFALRQLRHVLGERYGPVARRAVNEEALALSRVTGDAWSAGCVLQTLGIDARQRGDLAQSRAFLEESEALLRATGDHFQVGLTIQEECTTALAAGDFARAEALADELSQLERASGVTDIDEQTWWDGWLLGEVGRAGGDLARAIELHERSLMLAHRHHMQFPYVLTFLQLFLARSVFAAGDLARARDLLGQAGVRSGSITGLVRYWQGRVEWHAGDHRAAAEALQGALRRHCDRGDWIYVPEALETFAGMLAEIGQAAPAARLLATSTATRAAWGAPVLPVERPGVEATLAAARAALGEGFAAAWVAGEVLTLEKAVEEALALLDRLAVEEGRA
jgi:non-specific serine/threonine protein kinase